MSYENCISDADCEPARKGVEINMDTETLVRLKLPSELVRQVKIYCASTGQPMTRFFPVAVEIGLRKMKEQTTTANK